MIRLRKWLIKVIAGDMGVVLNAELCKGPDGEPSISYAGTKGRVCELSGVK